MNDKDLARLIKINICGLVAVCMLAVLPYLLRAQLGVLFVGIWGLIELTFLLILLITFAWRLVVCLRSRRKRTAIGEFQYTRVPKLLASVVAFLAFGDQMLVSLFISGLTAFNLACSGPFIAGSAAFFVIELVSARRDARKSK